MDGSSFIVHLIGHPGVGKYTVALALQRAMSDRGGVMRVVDNHHTANVVFSVVGADGVTPLPPAVWDRVAEVREAVHLAIEELAPPGWSYVFTNVLAADSPDEAVVERLRLLATRRSSRYVPVHLHADVDTIVGRVANPDRAARMKWIDPDGVRRHLATYELLRVDDDAALHLDVTTLAPDAAAGTILDHLDELGRGD